MTITSEQQTAILQVVTALFKAPPGGTYMTELANLVEGGVTKEQLANGLADTSIFKTEILAGKVTIEDQANVLLDHFGLTADAADPATAGSLAKAAFVQRLTEGKGFGEIVTEALAFLNTTTDPLFADSKALLDNKVQVAKIYSLNHSSTDVNELQSVLAGVSASFPKTEAEANEYLESIGQGNNPGDAFNLTFGADTLTGGAGNDTFNAGAVNNGAGTLVNSLEDIDTIDGASGTDTLNATINSAGPIAPAISNVEIINVRNVTADTTVDFTGVSGATQIWNNASQAGRVLTFTNVSSDATFGVRNTVSETVIDSFVDDVTGDADNLALAVTGAGNSTTDAVISSAAAGDIETITIAASGANLIDIAAFNAITTLTVTGAGSLEAVVDTTALETVEASGNTGGVTLDLSAATNDLTVTGGSGDDDITAGTGDDTIETGEGNDRVAFASATLDDLDTANGGDGDEDTIALDNADDATELDADAHTGFEILELGAATGAVTFDNDGFDFTKVLLAADLTQDLTLDNLGEGTVEVEASQAGVLTVSSTGTSDVLGLVVNAGAAVTLADVDVTDVETVNVSTTDETDDLTITTIEIDGVTGLKFSGAGDVVVSTVTDADAANDGVATVDLTEQTGEFTLAALGEATTFKFGNSGDVDITAEANATDTFEFTTAFDNEVRITDGEFGGDVSDDNINLAALGVGSEDELVFTANGADVEITSKAADDGSVAFEGTIVLVGTTINEINPADFVFA